MKNNYPIASFLLAQVLLFGVGLLGSIWMAAEAAPYGGIIILYFLWIFPCVAAAVALLWVFLGKREKRKTNWSRFKGTIVLWLTLYATGTFLYFRSIDLKEQKAADLYENSRKGLVDLINQQVQTTAVAWNASNTELEVIPTEGSPFITHLKTSGMLVVKPTQAFDVASSDTVGIVRKSLELSKPFFHDTTFDVLQRAISERRFCYRETPSTIFLTLPCEGRPTEEYMLEAQVSPVGFGIKIVLFLPKRGRISSALEPTEWEE